MKKYFYTLLFTFSLLSGLFAQEGTPARFVPPFDFDLTLSGNFGELRTNHFHGGIDFRSEGVSGKKTFAIADGYISRIQVTHGSGYMLHIRYDNGYSSIYRHLSGFVSPVKEVVEAYQYEHETYELSIVPDSTQYRVKAGEQVAWSGNTGYSFGPHLHLDLFKNETDDRVDPLPFFMDKIKDTLPPRAESIMIVPQPGKGLVEGKTNRVTFTPGSKNMPEVWGEIGFAIRAYDYMDGTRNRYGVRSVTLLANGEELFNSTVDRFSAYEDRMIYSWTIGGTYMKSYKDPGNKLRMLRPGNDNRGVFTIDEEREYQFEYILEDLYGNQSRYTFRVQGKEEEILPLSYNPRYYLKWDRVNLIHAPGLELILPKGVVYEDQALNFRIVADTARMSYTYQVHDETIPLHDWCSLRLAVLRPAIPDPSKYYVARVGKNGKPSSLGGTFEDGYMNTRTRELGTIIIDLDTITPQVTPVGN
ncbi:MAG: M23 family metallopeptidase, partial [Bacteroides sp.]|nr:M23 family metallopeptidase [Bacteroides sp.]